MTSGPGPRLAPGRPLGDWLAAVLGGLDGDAVLDWEFRLQRLAAPDG